MAPRNNNITNAAARNISCQIPNLFERLKADVVLTHIDPQIKNSYLFKFKLLTGDQTASVESIIGANRCGYIREPLFLQNSSTILIVCTFGFPFSD